ncbi:MAG: NAD(P)-binding domain-containing protein [Haloarculaceae archaeon]
MDDKERTVGFVGLGIMGLPSAKNLMDAGYHLVVNDIVGKRVAEAEAYGAALPSTAVAHELYKALEQQEKGDLDFAAVITVLEGLSGMEPTA